VIDPSKPTVGVGLGLPGIDPASAEKEVLENALKESDILAVEDVSNALPSPPPPPPG